MNNELGLNIALRFTYLLYLVHFQHNDTCHRFIPKKIFKNIKELINDFQSLLIFL